MRAVKINIESVQNSAGELIKLEQQSHGYLTFKASSWYLRYKDQEGIEYTYKYSADRLLVLRQGAVEHRQEFILGKERISSYFNTGIILEVKTITNKLKLEKLDADIKIYLEYQLYLNGIFQGINQVLIRTRECS